jgi:tRNA threonylcarbamoyladenosine biosynthesis protein TsaB
VIRFLFLSVASPFQLGVYEDSKLIKSYVADGKASDVLPVMIEEAIKNFVAEEIYYTNGPGNHMSLKIAFVCFKSLAIIKNIPLYGLNPFDFNANTPIRALAGSYFVHEKGNITLKSLPDQPLEQSFVLPIDADFAALGRDDEPIFLLPAV